MNSLSLLRRLVEQRQFESVLEACGAAASHDPGAQVLQALAHAQLGDGQAARAALRLLEPQHMAALDADARVDLAAVQLLLGDLDDAVRLLEAMRAEAPAHALLLARLATCRWQQQELTAARALYEQSLDLQPRMLVFQQLLRLYLQAGENQRAEHRLQQAQAFWAGERAHWPQPQAAAHDQQLRGLRLELWLAAGDLAASDAWLDAQQAQLGEHDWCELLQGHALRLAERAQHAAAEDMLRRALKHYPEHLSLYQQLAELAMLQGRSAQAMALLRRALGLAGQQPQQSLALRLKLAGTANQALSPQASELAQQALDAAQALQPGDDGTPAQIALWQAQAQVALAGARTQQQMYAEAETAYLQVLQAYPGLPAALQGLGHLYMQWGRMDAALELFEQLKALDPVRGHAALIGARRFPEDDATLQRLELQARLPGAEGPIQPGLLLQLAAAWEKRKDYEKAFALADEANAATRRLLRYDPQAHRQACARIRHAFSRSLYEHRRGIGNPSTLPVFVLGMPRSGTTLVEQILAGHSQIHGAGELGLIPGVIAGLERWERRVGSGRHYPDCVDDLSAQVVAGVAGNVLQELQNYAPEARHVVDKLPHNFEHIGLIKLLFPQARIISVRRDPRDIAVSNYFIDFAAKHGGMGFSYELGWIGEQLADHNLLMHHWNQLFPGEILEVRYEDVLEQPEREARRMLDHIGVGWEPEVLNFSTLDRPVKTASVWQVRQPLYQTSKAKWERYQQHLGPLIRGTNAAIQWQPITDMVALPVPGLLDSAVAQYREGQLDEAERMLQQLLHHLPGHAAAHFLLGTILLRKGHAGDALAHMERGVERCAWNAGWRRDLAEAYEMAGQPDKAAALRDRGGWPQTDDALALDLESDIEGDREW